jgi:uncharacterized protein YbjT (DUF2867 family)
LRMQKTVVVIGATGLVGSALVQELTDDPQVAEIRILSRRALSYASDKIKVIQTDLSQPEPSAFDNATALYCGIGTTRKKTPDQKQYIAIDHGITIAAAKAAKSKGVSEVHLISAVGADVKSNIFYSRLKGEIERDLIALNFDRTLIYQPSILIGPRAEKRIGEKIAQVLSPVFDLFLIGKLQKYHSISAKELAVTMHRFSFNARQGVQVLVYPELCKK